MLRIIANGAVERFMRWPAHRASIAGTRVSYVDHQDIISSACKILTARLAD